jgi:thiol-disulfide isomerase/thioredoxin
MTSAISRFSISAAVAIAFCIAGPHAQAAAPGAASAAQPTTRTAEDVNQEIGATRQSLEEVLGDPEALGDPGKRAQIAPKAIPLAKKMVSAITEMGQLRPDLKSKMDAASVEYLSLLSTLGDAGGTKQLATLAASKDVEESINGQSGQLETRWTLANKNVALQTAIVDELEKLDAAHRDSNMLTRLSPIFGQTAANQDISIRLRGLALSMTSTLAQGLNEEVKEMAEKESKIRIFEGKPAVIAGKTPDGKDFTTADWKGKVILVDFWATWCEPCKADLPRVKQVYTTYHPKGLEVVSVSNDYGIDALKAFLAQTPMPWPQLYDSAAGSQDLWNPNAIAFNIDAIPRMFLIDKKGILRTIDARDNMDTLIPKLLAE